MVSGFLPRAPEPTPSVPIASDLGDQEGFGWEKLVVFHSPPVAAITYTVSGLVGLTRIAFSRPLLIWGFGGVPFCQWFSVVGPRETQVGMPDAPTPPGSCWR